MGPQDATLSAALRALASEARRLRLALNTPRDGCACTLAGPCAHHATTANRLRETEAALALAVRELEHR